MLRRLEFSCRQNTKGFFFPFLFMLKIVTVVCLKNLIFIVFTRRIVKFYESVHKFDATLVCIFKIEDRESNERSFHGANVRELLSFCQCL